MSYYGGVYLKNEDGTLQAVLDGSSSSLVTMSWEHHTVHRGTMFTVKNFDDLALNAVLDLQIVTPNSAKLPHLEFFLETESETNWWLYEDVTITTPGTAIQWYNRRRNSATTTGVTVAKIVNTSIANANADTGIAGATAVYVGKKGSGRSGGEAGSRNELVLKPNTNYSLRFEAAAAGFVDYYLNWYDQEPVV